MTTLTKQTLDVRAAVMNGTSTLPLLYDIHAKNPDSEGPRSTAFLYDRFITMMGGEN
jgi:hypothetical protein